MQKIKFRLLLIGFAFCVSSNWGKGMVGWYLYLTGCFFYLLLWAVFKYEKHWYSGQRETDEYTFKA